MDQQRERRQDRAAYGRVAEGNVVHVDFGQPGSGRRRRPAIIDGPGWYHDEAIREEEDARADRLR